MYISPPSITLPEAFPTIPHSLRTPPCMPLPRYLWPRTLTTSTRPPLASSLLTTGESSVGPYCDASSAWGGGNGSSGLTVLFLYLPRISPSDATMYSPPLRAHISTPSPATALIAAASLATYSLPPARPTYSGLKCCVSTKAPKTGLGPPIINATA